MLYNYECVEPLRQILLHELLLRLRMTNKYIYFTITVCSITNNNSDIPIKLYSIVEQAAGFMLQTRSYWGV